MNSYQIKVETRIQGLAFSLDVKEDDTIQIVKEKIRDAEGVLSEQQILTCSGKALENNKTLKYYNIVPDAITTIYLTCRLTKTE